MATLLETKDGVKKVTYFDAKFAAKVLTVEGWHRYTTGQVIRLQDIKPVFLQPSFGNALDTIEDAS
jgi:hypothetical protein